MTITIPPKCPAGIADLFFLNPLDKLPECLISDKSGINYGIYGPHLLTIKNNPLHSIITVSSLADDDSQELLKEASKNFKIQLQKDTVYLVRNAWKDFQFDTHDFQYVMKYFQEVYDQYKSEACVLLLINLKLKQWKPFFVLQGDTSGGHVKYVHPTNITENTTSDILKYIQGKDDLNVLHKRTVKEYTKLYKEGWRIYGTIHSHCDFSAYHSGVDDNDEEQFDGLHITIGKVKSGFDFSIRFMLSGCEFKIDNIIEFLGLKSKNDLTNGLDKIVIQEKDWKLFTNQSITPPAPTQPTIGWSLWDRYDKNKSNNDKPDYQVFNPDKYYSGRHKAKRNLAKLYPASVFEIDELITITDGDGEFLIVKKDFYFGNRNTIFQDFKLSCPQKQTTNTKTNFQKYDNVICNGQQGVIINIAPEEDMFRPYAVQFSDGSLVYAAEEELDLDVSSDTDKWLEPDNDDIIIFDCPQINNDRVVEGRIRNTEVLHIDDED